MMIATAVSGLLLFVVLRIAPAVWRYRSHAAWERYYDRLAFASTFEKNDQDIDAWDRWAFQSAAFHAERKNASLRSALRFWEPLPPDEPIYPVPPPVRRLSPHPQTNPAAPP
jgi:hypothetical protein